MQLTEDQKVLRAIWTKAVEQGRLETPGMPKAAAFRLRFRLYSEAKKMREEAVHGLVDELLVEGMGGLVVRMAEVKGKPWVIRIESGASAALGQLASQMGLDVSGAEGQQNAMASSLQRLKSLMDGEDVADLAQKPQSSYDPDAIGVNPFYQREGGQ